MTTTHDWKRETALWETLRNTAYELRSRTKTIEALAHSFPSLRNRFEARDVPLIDLVNINFDPVMFDYVGRLPETSRCALAFCRWVALSGWIDKNEWKGRGFYLHEALSLWTEQDRAAFIAWAVDPWFGDNGGKI